MTVEPTKSTLRYRGKLERLLGNTGQEGRFLDAMEYWVEVEIERLSLGDLSTAQQRTRLYEIADAANKLSRMLGNLDEDTDAILRYTLLEKGDSLGKEIPELKNKLDRLRDAAKQHAEYLQRPVDAPKSDGRPTKADRDKFIQRILTVYYQYGGSFSAYGDKKKFENIAAILCKEVGYDVGSLDKVTRKARNIVPRPD